jgi:non-specific protein-tyrosine kinase
MMQNHIELDSGNEQPLDLLRYLHLARHWAWLFALVVLVAGGAAYLVSRRMAPVYAAQTTILINEAPATRSADFQSLQLSERLTFTYSKLILNRPILAEVQRLLNLPELKPKTIIVAPERNTQLIKITAEYSDAEGAAAIANTLVKVFSEDMVKLQSSRFAASKANLQNQIQEMELQLQETATQIQQSAGDVEKNNLEARRTQYRQIYSNLLLSLEQVRMAEAQSVSNVVQVEPALPDARPVRPRTARMAVIAAFLALLLAAGAVYGLDALDDTIKDPEELARQVGLPMLGVIAAHATAPGELIAIKEPRSPVTEAFRSLRTNVHFAGVDQPMRRLMVTSPTPGDGKSTISANLAVVLAQSGIRVCLVDADLRRPRVHHLLALPNGSGLSGLFVQQEPDVDGAILPAAGAEGLQVLTAGAIPPNPSELLGSNKMKTILNTMLEKSSLLLLDTPPVMSVTDAAVLARQSDGVLIVFRPGSTKMTAMKQAVGQLRRVNANLVGLVANNVNLDRGGYANYYYREYYNKYSYHAADGAGSRIRHWSRKLAQRGGLAK